VIVPSKPERKTLQKIAGELLVECGIGMRRDEPAWIQMKPGPRDEVDHTGPDLIGASSTDDLERSGEDSLPAESAWISTSTLLAIAGDADLA
jgi:hypothetical protein